MKLLFTGASGLVGSYLVDRLASSYDLLAPSHGDFDVTNADQVMTYILKCRPDVVIHAAGVADPKRAERERGDEGGLCFRTNVLGTRYVKEASEKVGAFFIHISTGSVFFGSEKNSGPFSESARLPARLDGMSWYGWTKVLSEKEAGESSAIVRLSKPLSHERHFLSRLGKLDYLGKLLFEYENQTLGGLMTDQLFPVVSMDEIVQLLHWIIEHKSPGVYHAASPDMVSPYELLSYRVIKLSSARAKKLLSYKVIELSRDISTLEVTFEEFIKTQELPLRHQKYSAIDSRGTVEKTGIRFIGWREVVRVAFVSSPTRSGIQSGFPLSRE